MAEKNGLDTIMENASIMANNAKKNEQKKDLIGGAPKKIGRPKKASKKGSKKASKKGSKKGSKSKLLKRGTPKKAKKASSKKASSKKTKKTKK
jgi:hypothetical protein